MIECKKCEEPTLTYCEAGDTHRCIKCRTLWYVLGDRMIEVVCVIKRVVSEPHEVSPSMTREEAEAAGVPAAQLERIYGTN